MPRLLIFAPCENVLLGQSQDASLIVILHQLTHTLTKDAPDPLPEGAATQMKWYVFAQYEVLEGEAGQTFDQKIVFVGADNKEWFSNIADFTVGVQPLHRMIAQLTFFPLVPAGTYRLKLFLRRHGQEQWAEYGSYPMEIVYQRVREEVGAG